MESSDARMNPVIAECLELMRSNAPMSLRDYFAGQALAGVLASDTSLFAFTGSNPGANDARVVLANNLYQFADALLAAREVQP